MSSIIVAQANNRVIGKGNNLPWHLPADLKHFRDITTDHTVIMGGNTYLSIVDRLGKALPNRRNIVISPVIQNPLSGFEIFASLESLIKHVDLASDDVYIIGGAMLYKTMLEKDAYVNKIYLTQIHASINGDTYFPKLDPSKWQEISRENHRKDDKNNYDYDFIELRRIK